MEKNPYANLLVKIIEKNPGKIIYSTEINSVIKEVLEDTGVLIGAKKTPDTYEAFKWDGTGETFQRTRPNNRKFTLSIKSNERKSN